MDRCRQRIQQQSCVHRGRTSDPLYGIRRLLCTGTDLLTERQAERLDAVFADEQHLEVEITWTIYQRIVAAHRNPDRAASRAALTTTIRLISRGVPEQLSEAATLGRTLKRRMACVLAYFDRPGASNRPTEAINGRLEHLRAPPSASATAPTTSPDHHSKPPRLHPQRDEPPKPKTHLVELFAGTR